MKPLSSGFFFGFDRNRENRKDKNVIRKIFRWTGLLLAALYTWLVFPNTKRTEKMKPFTQTDYAHRGLHAHGVPENSLGAFRRAAAYGYGIEFDVQLSKDGVPVVFHDDTLERICQREGNVEELSREEILLPLQSTEEILPTLQEVLLEVGGRVPLLIELKVTKRKKELVDAVLKELEDYTGPYLIESFDPLVLNIVRKKAPAVLVGQLSGGLYHEKRSLSRFLADRLLWNAYSRPDFIAYQHRYGRWFLQAYHALFRVPIFSYTIDNQRDYHKKSWFTRHIFEGFLPPRGG